MTAIPLRTADLTPSRLSDLLGAEVTAVEILDRAVATNERLRIALHYRQPGAGPPSLFVKLASADPEHRQMIGAGPMGQREVDFYRDVAPVLDLRVPRSYFGATSEDGCFVLLLEDLAATGCRFPDGGSGVSADQAAGTLEDLARLHARFEPAEARRHLAPWLATPSGVGQSEWVPVLLDQVLEAHGHELTPAYAEAGRLYVAHHARIDRIWDEGPSTLIHGDPHIGNVFLDGSRVGFFDWGLSRVSTHMRDVSYFLTMAVDPRDRRGAEADLLRLYADALRAAGGAQFGFDDLWAAHRVHAAYTVVATFLAFMPTYVASDVQQLAADLLHRAQLALDELGVVDALRSALAA